MFDADKIQWPGWDTVRLIGRGSFAAVYEIKRTILGGEEEYAAMKVISIPQTSSDIEDLRTDGFDNETIKTIFTEHLESIVKEYSTMKKMSGSHNVVECDDVRYFPHEDGFGWDIFIKMELLTPLSKLLLDDIDEKTILKIGIDICSALELCKINNIIHRDIKPQNIFLSKYNDYKLGDFGIAKSVEKTISGTKIGTYDYMAPEVYNNQPYGFKADMYSLGLVLYWLLNNRRLPFLPQPPEIPSTRTREEARQRRFNGEYIPEPKNGSTELKRLVLKACAFNESDRFINITEMKNSLLAILNKPISPTAPPPPPEPLPEPLPPKTAIPWKKIMIAVSIVAIAIFVGISIANNSKEEKNSTTEQTYASDVNKTEPSDSTTTVATTQATTEPTTTTPTTTTPTTTKPYIPPTTPSTTVTRAPVWDNDNLDADNWF